MPYEIQIILIGTEQQRNEIHELIIYPNDQMKTRHMGRSVVYQNDPKHLK